MANKKWSSTISAILMIFLVLCAAMLSKAYFNGKFSSVKELQIYIKGFGVLAPLILFVLQVLQVIIPILPGFLGCAVGAVLFGSMYGFWINYIGISAGSILAFILARHFGKQFVESLFPKNKYEKWSNWAAKSKCYTLLLFAGMILPLFPDDFFCYFSGLTKMSTKKFIWIIILGKPWCILAYSLGFSLLS